MTDLLNATDALADALLRYGATHPDRAAREALRSTAWRMYQAALETRVTLARREFDALIQRGVQPRREERV